MIRNVNSNDAQQIADIYNHYVINSTATFEENPVSLVEMERRVSEIAAFFPWIVYEEQGTIIGYSYANQWKGRSAYRFSVETTIYVSKDAVGTGIGTNLYKQLIERIKAIKMHVVIAGLALPNEKCQRLHEKFAFKKVAHFSEVGFKCNKWIDVGYWELLLSYYC